MSWRNIFKPSAKYSVLTLLVIGIIIGVVGYFATQNILHATSTNAFCMTCHAQHSLEDEVMASSHGNNAAGIVAQCSDCHLPPGQFEYLVKKIIVSKDVYGYFAIDGFETQEWLEANRKEQAELSRDYLRSIDSRSCQTCHNRIKDDPAPNTKKMAQRMHTMNYKKPEDQRKTCIDCHKGVAHPYPDD